MSSKQKKETDPIRLFIYCSLTSNTIDQRERDDDEHTREERKKMCIIIMIMIPYR